MRYIKAIGIVLAAFWFLTSVAVAAVVIVFPDSAGILGE